MKKIKLTIIALLALTVISSLPATAQKLPQIQQASLRAPANIKIDGKATEWNNEFQAHNVSNHIFYTISNSEQFLYLTVHAKSEPGIRKLMMGGLAFTVIQPVGAKRLRFNYPIYSVQTGVEGGSSEGASSPLNTLSYTAFNYQNLSRDTAANKTKMNYLIELSNQSIGKYFKDVEVTGIKEIRDTILSIYNPEGIRVSALFNNKMEYNYELAIPLKYLGDEIKNNGKFEYNIRLNAQPTVLIYNYEPRRLPPGAVTAKRSDGTPRLSQDEIFVMFPSDFSGEYTLAK